MLKNISRIILPALLSVLALGCNKDPDWMHPSSRPGNNPETPVPEPEKPAPGVYVLPLIETTDMHGHLVDTDNNGKVHYHLAYIADKADDIRGHGEERKMDRLLLLDGGDLYQGASISNLLSGWPMFASLDMMGYDAVALGNHEFDWGIENTVDSDSTLPDYEWNGSRIVNDIPVLCANLYKDGSRVSFTSDYTIVEKTAVGPDGATIPVKIGIVGFAVNYSGSIITTQFNGRGFTIDENYSIANSIASNLETSLGCDATILLIHGQAETAAGNLGSGSPFDLVLGGHSHSTMKGTTAWGLAYLQGGRYCEHYATAELRFTLDKEDKLSFSGVANMNIPSVNNTRDLHSSPGQNADDLSEEILSVSDAALEATAQQQNDVIGYIATDATTYYLDGSGQRATTMGNWMCDIIRRIGGADVAFVNAGGIRTTFPLNGQPRRDITVANVYEMFPFSNTTYVYRLNYKELLQVFRYALTSGGSSLFSYMSGIDCIFSNGSVQSLVMNGTTIYSNGTWTGDWASREVLLSVSEYLAITSRTDYYTNIANPLVEWNSTSRLIQNGLIDNENAVQVLREEAAESGGLLWIDNHPHFILAQ